MAQNTMYSNMTDMKALKMLQNGAELNSMMISALLDWHQKEAQQLEQRYAFYQAQSLEIQDRELPDTAKINTELNNDYMGVIIDQCVGYVFGKAITYSIDETEMSESEYKAQEEYLSDFVRRNSLADLDAETGKMAAICGKTYRLCYVDEELQTKVMDLKPWEVILLQENNKAYYAIRYYDSYNAKGEETRFVEVYTDTTTYYYEEKVNKSKQEFILTEESLHLFSYVPIIEFKNNNELLGDFDKVYQLIMAYDRLASDSQNELEEFRQAYMVFDGGAEITKEIITAARQSGAFSLPEGSKAYFLTKQIDVNSLTFQKDLLENNIYKFSKSVDMSDEKFSGGTQSGESRKWKLIDLENKAITKERKFTHSLEEMFKVICSAENKRQVAIDHLNIYFTFTRNLPLDLNYLAETATKLKGVLSQKTTLEMLALTDDVEYELELQKDEQEESLFTMNLTQQVADTERLQGNKKEKGE